MAAHDHLSPLQFEHGINHNGIHRLDAVDHQGNSMGFMTWHSRPDIDEGFIRYQPGEVGNIRVEEEHRRKGIATALWHEGQKYEPKPVHSPYRTDQGDAWARTIGGPLPTADRETGERRYG